MPKTKPISDIEFKQPIISRIKYPNLLVKLNSICYYIKWLNMMQIINYGNKYFTSHPSVTNNQLNTIIFYVKFLNYIFLIFTQLYWVCFSYTYIIQIFFYAA